MSGNSTDHLDKAIDSLISAAKSQAETIRHKCARIEDLERILAQKIQDCDRAQQQRDEAISLHEDLRAMMGAVNEAATFRETTPKRIKSGDRGWSTTLDAVRELAWSYSRNGTASRTVARLEGLVRRDGGAVVVRAGDGYTVSGVNHRVVLGMGSLDDALRGACETLGVREREVLERADLVAGESSGLLARFLALAAKAPHGVAFGKMTDGNYYCEFTRVRRHEYPTLVGAVEECVGRLEADPGWETRPTPQSIHTVDAMRAAGVPMTPDEEKNLRAYCDERVDEIMPTYPSGIPDTNFTLKGFDSVGVMIDGIVRDRETYRTEIVRLTAEMNDMRAEMATRDAQRNAEIAAARKERDAAIDQLRDMERTHKIVAKKDDDERQRRYDRLFGKYRRLQGRHARMARQTGAQFGMWLRKCEDYEDRIRRLDDELRRWQRDREELRAFREHLGSEPKVLGFLADSLRAYSGGSETVINVAGKLRALAARIEEVRR